MKKKITTLLSLLVVLGMLVSGTFAWVNFSQNVLNEFEGGETTPGGTTHDDFDRPTKEVYVENWGTVPIFVRIRLDEYMEIGDGAGLKGTYSGNVWIKNPDNHSKSVLPGANIDDKTTWRTHIPILNEAAKCEPTPVTAGLYSFHHYWQWSMGGQKWYMPANSSLRQNLSYIAQDTTEYNGTEPGVKRTLYATVMTMAQWIAAGQQIGNFWVIDTDGWAYWAAPLMPGNATGLLINKVELIVDPEDSYYYAINIFSQMATKNGAQNYKDFYNDSDDDHTATEEGKDLLDIITGGTPGNRVNSIMINGARPRNMNVGDTATLTATTDPLNSTATKSWYSSNPSVATIDSSSGNIVALKEGQTVITVTAGGKSDSITVNVEKVNATGIVINGASTINMVVGDTLSISCYLIPSNSTDIPTWSSGHTNTATVTSASANGLTATLTAAGVGTTTITATARPGVTATVNVIVTAAPLTSITIDGTKPKNMNVGDTATLTATTIPANSTYTKNWQSSDPSVATIDSNSGYIVALKEGQTVITVTAGGKSDTVTVNVANVNAHSIVINGARTINMTVGDTLSINCSLSPSNSTDIPTWSSGHTNTATVTSASANGLTATLTAAGVGTTTITATARPGVTDTINVIVTAVPPNSITIDGAKPKNMTVGDTATLTATTDPANNTATKSWQSSDPSVATINSSSGYIVALKKGQTVITVTAGGKSDTVTVNVADAVDPNIPTKNGEGPYDTKYTSDPYKQSENYALKASIRNDVVTHVPGLSQNGSIKLSSIISGDDYSGITVQPVDSKYNGKIFIDVDKDGDPAIIYTYIPTNSEWMAVYPGMPVINAQIWLIKSGYQNTRITITMRYTGSLYLFD